MAFRRHQHQPELGHPEQLESLLVAWSVYCGRANDRPIEAGTHDQLLGLAFGRAVERQLRLARGERGDMDETLDAARSRRGEHAERAFDIALRETGGVGRADRP